MRWIALAIVFVASGLGLAPWIDPRAAHLLVLAVPLVLFFACLRLSKTKAPRTLSPENENLARL